MPGEEPAVVLPCLSAGMSELHQPLEDRLEIGLFLGRDAIAGYFSVADALQVHGVDQLIHGQLIREIRLITQDEQRDALQGWANHQGVQLFAGLGQELYVGDVHDKDDRIDAAAISLPHGTEPRLPAQVPAFQRHMSLLHFLHIEPDRWDRTACHLGQSKTRRVTMVRRMTPSRMSLESPDMGDGSGGMRLLDGEFSALGKIALESLYMSTVLGTCRGVLPIRLSKGKFFLRSEVRSW